LCPHQEGTPCFFSFPWEVSACLLHVWKVRGESRRLVDHEITSNCLAWMIVKASLWPSLIRHPKGSQTLLHNHRQITNTSALKTKPKKSKGILPFVFKPPCCVDKRLQLWGTLHQLGPYVLPTLSNLVDHPLGTVLFIQDVPQHGKQKTALPIPPGFANDYLNM